MKGGHGPTKQLQNLNWDAFDHASHAPQLKSCNYYMYVCMHVWRSAIPLLILADQSNLVFFFVGQPYTYIHTHKKFVTADHQIAKFSM